MHKSLLANVASIPALSITPIALASWLYLDFSPAFSQEKSTYIIGPTEFRVWNGPPGLKNMTIKFLGPAGEVARMTDRKGFWDIDRVPVEERKIQAREAISYFNIEGYNLHFQDMVEYNDVRYSGGNIVTIFRKDGKKICQLSMKGSSNTSVGATLKISMLGCFVPVLP